MFNRACTVIFAVGLGKTYETEGPAPSKVSPKGSGAILIQKYIIEKKPLVMLSHLLLAIL